MEKQDLTFQEKKEIILKFRETLNLSTNSKELGISKSLLTLILNGERRDKRGVINYIYNKTIETLNTIMPVG